MSTTRKILLIAGAVVFVIIAVIGMALGNHKKSPATSNSNQAQKQSTSATDNTTRHTPNEALTLVRTTYLKAAGYITRHTTPDQGEIDTIKDSLSTDLYAGLTQTLLINNATSDQILCTTQGANAGYNVQLAFTDGATADIKVTENYTVPVVVDYMVDLTTLKITQITCPGGQ